MDEAQNRHRLAWSHHCELFARNALLRSSSRDQRHFKHAPASQHRSPLNSNRLVPSLHPLDEPSGEACETSSHPQLPLAQQSVHQHLHQRFISLGRL